MALVLAGTGERLWLGFAPKYLQTLGATVLVIGIFDAPLTLLGAFVFLAAALCGALGTIWFWRRGRAGGHESSQ